MYSRILIPVDGSEQARRAAEHGLALAAAFDAAVDLLHVLERDGLRLTTGDDEQRRLRDRGETVLAGVESLASDLDRPVRTVLREGRPAARIAEYAAERDVDLVVLGRQGLTGLGRRLLGGVTERLLHRGDVPVLVVPVDAPVPDENGYGPVLVPTDGSEAADAAVPHGAAVAGRYGAAVHVLNVVDLQAAGGLFDAGGLEGAFVDRLERAGQDAVERVASAVHEASPDTTVETTVVRAGTSGAPDGAAAAIRAHVDERDVGLVVMGSRGRSGLRRGLMGSVASAVLRSVDVPVLVASPGSAAASDPDREA
jgi:nucleotide-binding universal stress UspA family protein